MMRRLLPHARTLALVAIVLTGVGLRSVYAVRHADRLVGDGATYHRLTTQLLEDGYLGYSAQTLRSWRPPLYPVFLAGVYAVSGAVPLHGKLAGVLVAALTTILIARLGRRLGAPDAGLVGALAYALYGHEIRHATGLYAETLMATLITLIVFLEYGPRALSRLGSLRQGALIGILLHLQPGLAGLSVFLAARRLLRDRTRRGTAAAGLLLLGTVLALVPWTVRNYAVHEKFVFVTTNGGFNLLRGHNNFADGDCLAPEGVAWVQSYARSVPRSLGEPGFDRRLRERAIAWMRDHPGRTATLAAMRTRYWWLPRHLIEPGSRWPVTYGLVFPFALLGVFVCRRLRTPLAPLLLTILAASVPSILIVYAGQRYRSPVAPLFALLAGFGVVAAARWVRARVTSG